MLDEVSQAFKEGISKSLRILREHIDLFSEPHLVWEKRDGEWRGQYQQRPSLLNAYIAAQSQLEAVSAEFNDLFFISYREYGEGLIGNGTGFLNLAHQKSRLIGNATSLLWERHGTFDCDENQIDAIATEFATFVDQRTVRLRFQAQLLNFRMDVADLSLPEDLAIRRLSEQEMSVLHGGSLENLAFKPFKDPMMDEFVIEADFDEATLFQPNENPTTTRDQFKSQLDKAVLTLRTFKDGPVGYGEIRARFLTFCPLIAGSMRFHNEYTPMGTYHISGAEVGALCEHARWVFMLSEASIETACFRLAAAATRLRPQDQLVDAVIGMEALLLAALGNDKGELGFRLSQNYATLFTSAQEKYRAYKIAKDLYGLRSKIAHGGKMGEGPFRIGEEKLGLKDAARCATEALRSVIKRFLPQSRAAPYKRPEFWERAYFGVEEQDSTALPN